MIDDLLNESFYYIVLYSLITLLIDLYNNSLSSELVGKLLILFMFDDKH